MPCEVRFNVLNSVRLMRVMVSPSRLECVERLFASVVMSSSFCDWGSGEEFFVELLYIPQRLLQRRSYEGDKAQGKKPCSGIVFSHNF